MCGFFNATFLSFSFSFSLLFSIYDILVYKLTAWGSSLFALPFSYSLYFESTPLLIHQYIQTFFVVVEWFQYGLFFFFFLYSTIFFSRLGLVNYVCFHSKFWLIFFSLSNYYHSCWSWTIFQKMPNKIHRSRDFSFSSRFQNKNRLYFCMSFCCCWRSQMFQKQVQPLANFIVIVRERKRERENERRTGGPNDQNTPNTLIRLENLCYYFLVRW